ncbi:hypothetical protein ACFQ1E_11660 [Sphingomonas canadensis]|uniref:Uncharacterized protein n=1 Tax=Sphingomonas canadensis TaxID=1219257 RepID=A0ABW3H978_9SPHN|nr:hypothetical protein [Sphingomonas canadensis]MCW3836870.1 hypothetical protein [Sphingomonas canadensis]
MVQVPLPPSAPASADDPDPARAALACGPAVFATESKKEGSVETRLEAEAVRFFYAITATRIDPSSAAFNSRLFGTLGRMERPPLASAKTAEIAAACDRRFPVARRTTPAVLPVDPRERNMTCSSALVFIDGALERIAAKNIPESLEWVSRERTRFAARIFYERSTNAALEGDGYDKAVNRRIQASQNIANYYRIAIACRTAA